MAVCEGEDIVHLSQVSHTARQFKMIWYFKKCQEVKKKKKKLVIVFGKFESDDMRLIFDFLELSLFFTFVQLCFSSDTKTLIRVFFAL